MLIDVPRQSARPKKSKQKARDGHPGREAEVALRYREIEFQPPAQHLAKQAIKLWVVHVRETRQPRAAERIEWFLLSSRRIESVEQAQLPATETVLRQAEMIAGDLAGRA